MKFRIHLLCAATLITAPSFAGASEIPLPERKPNLIEISTNSVLPPVKPQIKQAAAPASAQTQPTAQTQKHTTIEGPNTFVVSHKSDLMLSCQQLRTEASDMLRIISDTENVKDRSTIQSHGISAAGAVGSFLIGSVTGGIGLAAAGLMLDHNVTETKDDADEVQDIAEQRRTWLKGLYTAQACDGPFEPPAAEAKIKEIAKHKSTIEKLASIETAAGDQTSPTPSPIPNPAARSAAQRAEPLYQADLNTPYND